MSKRNLIKKGEKYAFDHLCRRVAKKGSQASNISKNYNPGLDRVKTGVNLDKTHFRLTFLEKPVNKWLEVGKDMRGNIYALLMTAVCFVVVFGTVIAYENRHLRLEALATLPKEQLDRDAYRDYLEREGRVGIFDYDSARDFNTI